ncbi:MAG TPA: hypothetical protein VIM47_00830 [Dermatophilaceae bacterium]
MRTFLHDQWSPLSHIDALPDGHDSGHGRPLLVASWIDDPDARRLTAYRILSAYADNVRRYYLPERMWAPGAGLELDSFGNLPSSSEPSDASKIREYGHAGLVVDAARALVLGEDQTIVVVDPNPTTSTGTDGTPGPDVESPAVAAVRDWLTDWAAREKLTGKLLTGEADTITDGDGVYVLGWSPRAGRPKLRVYDPGFYFPDLLAAERAEYADWDDDDFPPVVHLAWETAAADGATTLRRTTWRMAKLPVPVKAPWGGTRAWTCVMDVISIRTDRLQQGWTIYNLPADAAAVTVVQEPTDLGVDFMPVVHVPNDEPGGRHFGRSTLMRVAMILDDLMGADTDLSISSELSAPSPTVVIGAGAPRLDGGPGVQWNAPAGSSLSQLDTSKSLDAQLKYATRLLEMLSQNTRLAMTLLGRVDITQAPSGYALELGFAPTSALVREMRAVRAVKYPLILRFALRLAQVNDSNAVPAGPTPDLSIDLGAALPADLPAAISAVKELLPIRAISTPTAVRMLMRAGLPIEDAEDEIAAIEAEALAGGHVLPPPTMPAPPEPPVPPVPPVPPPGA